MSSALLANQPKAIPSILLTPIGLTPSCRCMEANHRQPHLPPFQCEQEGIKIHVGNLVDRRWESSLTLVWTCAGRMLATKGPKDDIPLCVWLWSTYISWRQVSDATTRWTTGNCSCQNNLHYISRHIHSDKYQYLLTRENGI